MTAAPDLDALCGLAGRLLGQPVAADDRLVVDLGAESIDLVNLVAEVEERYAVVVDEEQLAHIHTVRDLHRVISGVA